MLNREYLQQQAAGGHVPGQVAALAVAIGACRDFHQERDPVGGDMAEDAHVQERAEVVRIGNECVTEARSQEPLQQAGGLQGMVDVRMSGRAPFQGGIVGPGNRSSGGQRQLGHAVLTKGQGQAGGVAETRVALRQSGQRIGLGGKAVHQQERKRGAAAAAQKLHLADDDVEKRQPVFGEDERFGLFQPHAGAQAAIQLDDDGTAKGGFGGGIEFVQFFEAAQRAEGAQASPGNDAEIPGIPAL